MGYVIRKIPVDPKGTLLNKSAQIVGYADDLNIMARSQLKSKEIYEDLERAAKEIGLQINEDKTKIMIQTRRKVPTRQNLTIAEHNLEIVKDFIYTSGPICQRTVMSPKR